MTIGLNKILSGLWFIIGPEVIFRIVFVGLAVLIITGFYNLYKGLKKQESEDYKEAIKCYKQVIKYAKIAAAIQRLIIGTDNQDAEIFKVMADVSKNDKNHEVQKILGSSYAYYEFKNTIFSTDIVAAAYNGIGNIKAAINEEYDEAINNYDKAIRRDSKNIFYHNRGSTKVRSDDYKGAIEDFNEAIELDPKYVYAYHNRGVAKGGLGDHKGAISDYSHAIELDEEFFYAYYNRGNAKYALEDYEGAVSDYIRAIELNEEFFYAYYNRGIAKDNLGDYEGAILDFGRTIELNSKYAHAYYGRGLVKGRLGNYKEATSDFEQVIELDKEFPTTDKNREKAVIMYFQSAYNQHCIQGENINNKISVDGNFGPRTRKALEMAKAAPPDSECHKAYSTYKDILDKIMEEPP